MSDKALTIPELLEQTGVTPVLPGTPEIQALIGSGYDGLTEKEAKAILAARKEDPHSFPYEMQKKAEAFLAAVNTRAVVISKRPMFKRKASRA